MATTGLVSPDRSVAMTKASETRHAESAGVAVGEAVDARVPAVVRNAPVGVEPLSDSSSNNSRCVSVLSMGAGLAWTLAVLLEVGGAMVRGAAPARVRAVRCRRENETRSPRGKCAARAHGYTRVRQRIDRQVLGVDEAWADLWAAVLPRLDLVGEVVVDPRRCARAGEL